MILLINKAKVSQVLQVSVGYNEDEFDVFVREAQDFDLKPLLCEEFYFELLEKKDIGAWKLIIDGGDYSYQGKNISFRGLADVLSYFTYARFVMKSNAVSTSHGIANKTTPYSTPLDNSEKNNLYYKYKKDAGFIFEDVKRFVERNITTYASWSACNERCAGASTGFKQKVIK